MKPLVIVDLMSHTRDYAPMVVENHHKYTAPQRPVRVVGLADDWAAAFADAGGIQVTGSTDMLSDVSWAAPLGRAVEDAARAGIPVLGVCFGHQMLGVHFGATLESWAEPRLGVVTISCQEAGPFVAGDMDVFLTHRDWLSDLGPTLQCVATGGFGGIQAWAHPTLPIWGIQGHPEADAALALRAEGPDALAGIDTAVLDTPGAKRFLHRFGALMR